MIWLRFLLNFRLCVEEMDGLFLMLGFDSRFLFLFVVEIERMLFVRGEEISRLLWMLL